MIVKQMGFAALCAHPGSTIRHGLLCAALAGLAWVAGGCAGGRIVVSEFGAKVTCEGRRPRDIPHLGIDIVGSVGEPVLAPADGFVTFSGDHSNWQCGRSVIISHGFGARTVYCHLSGATAKPGDVKRGEIIGYLGNTGLKSGPGCEHLHFELHHGGGVVDPVPFIVGCFDAKITLPIDRLLLTWPLRCGPTR